MVQFNGLFSPICGHLVLKSNVSKEIPGRMNHEFGFRCSLFLLLGSLWFFIHLCRFYCFSVLCIFTDD